MDYIKIRFGDDLDQLGCRFEKTIQDMFRSMNPMFSAYEQAWKPQMDIYETENEILVLAEIAGINKDDLHIEIDTKALRIHGTRGSLACLDDARFRLAEIQYGKFERAMVLPNPVDPDKAVASYRDGVLQIKIPKRSLPKPLTIPISEG